jgi:hypothetical protein
MAVYVGDPYAEIERLRWYLHEITKAWDCGDDDEVAALLNNVDAHQWCDEYGFLPSDESIRRVYVEMERK